MNLSPNVSFVLFGATGDLARTKIVPALFDLFHAGELPSDFSVICLGRSEPNQVRLIENYRSNITIQSRHGPPQEDQWRAFSGNFHYLQADLRKGDTYERLRQMLEAVASHWRRTPEVIHYLAVPPDLVMAVTDGLGRAGLAADRAHVRIVVEKPLGRDLASFLQVNERLCLHFEEKQIFRIDHYLGKETVQNILALRFANPLFEPIWNRHYIDHVAITLSETEGINQRARYYEEAGALRDVVQNHLLQLLCLIAMEPPSSYTAENLRDRKMDVMVALRPISGKDISRVAARGQYGRAEREGRIVPAYREESGVAADSMTETFAALKLFVENWRWHGVPFYLRSGKRLAHDRSEISIRFQRVPHCFFPECSGLNERPAQLTFQLQPDPAILLTFAAKEPGYRLTLRPVTLRFGYRETFGGTIPDAYETLLRDVLLGDATLFMRADQVEAAWRLVDPVLQVWQSEPAEFPNYSAGGDGPAEADALLRADGRAWDYPPVR